MGQIVGWGLRAVMEMLEFSRGLYLDGFVEMVVVATRVCDESSAHLEQPMLFRFSSYSEKRMKDDIKTHAENSIAV